ncbi:hypothetical protein ACF0H5_009514 [Mactra antiquata]
MAVVDKFNANMWKSAEYCDYSNTWPCNRDPDFLSSYNIIQECDRNYWSVDAIDSSAENVLTHSHITYQRGESLNDLEITCQCKNHNGVSVIGFNIISEARTIEVYSSMDGYLLTVKGDNYLVDDHTREINNGENFPELYCCKAKLENSAENITFKFLGIGEKVSIKIYKLHLYLQQSAPISPISQMIPGKIDMVKVKGYLHSMGDSVPENGTKLLHAVEDYQQSQMSRFAGLQSLGAESENNLGILSSLLSMATKSSKGTESKRNITGNGDSSRTLSVEPTQNGGPLSAMLMSMSRSKNGCQGDSTEKDEMFSMLQNICGSVGKMRVNEQTSSKPDSSTDADDINRTKDSPRTKDGITVRDEGEKNKMFDMTMVQSLIEQTVSQMLEQSEQKFKHYIDTSLEAMELRLSTKLDNLIALVSNNTSTQNQTNTNNDETL